jgi:hypothetical protein
MKKNLNSDDQEEFEDNKGVNRICISKKNRQHNGQKYKQRSTKQTHKTKDPVTRTQLKTEGELRSTTYRQTRTTAH